MGGGTYRRMRSALDLDAQNLEGELLEGGRAALAVLAELGVSAGVADVLARVADEQAVEIVLDGVANQDALVHELGDLDLRLLERDCCTPSARARGDETQD